MSHLAKKCIFRLKKVPKRFGESEKVATFATALREKHSSKAKKQVLKIFEKFLQKDLEKRKTCLTFATAFASKTKATFWKKKFEKSFKKIWWFEKKVLPLHHFPLRKSGQAKRGLRASQNRKCSYRNIRTTFFEVIEQQSFYPLERVISNNTFEIRAEDLTKHFLQWRVWSWLRMNASGRPNTCKSRGI